MPTRQEVLYIHARFLRRRYETMWRIRRIGEAVILSHKYDIDRELTPKDREFFEYSRTGLLDRTIDAVLEEKAGGKED
jgi:predicted metal-dependent phosphoesterase TrpH